MSSPIRVLVADDHPVVRKGMIQIILEDPDMQVIGEANDGQEALDFLAHTSVDVVVSDFDMPKINGLKLAERLSAADPPIPVVLLTMHEDEGLFNAAIDCGVTAYLLKDEVIDTIAMGIRAASRGESFVSPSLSKFIMGRSRQVTELRNENQGLASLTKSEKNILKLVAQNYATKEIANSLGISDRTVSTHRRNISQKLKLTGKHPLINFALSNRSAILSLPE